MPQGEKTKRNRLSDGSIFERKKSSDEISKVSLEKLLIEKVLKIIFGEFTVFYRARVNLP